MRVFAFTTAFGFAFALPTFALTFAFALTLRFAGFSAFALRFRSAPCARL